tara:strand:+ start:57 stop:164 length:108 start_codon:yes stop_codon:yes gene_type:complete
MKVFAVLGMMFLNIYFVMEALVLIILIKLVMGLYK